MYISKHNTNTNTHTRISTHPYEYMYAHTIPMSIFKRLSRHLEIHEVDHQECLAVDRDIASH
jgi:hypothetical protein